MRDTSARDCEVLFDVSVSGRMDRGWQMGVLHQRTRTIKHGPMMDVTCFPVWDTQTAQAAKSEARRERHRKAQEALNRKNARRRLVRLVNENFTDGDLIVTCEYALGKQPQEDDRAARDIRNYLKRIAYLRKKRGMEPMRYIYITEVTSSAKYGVRYHHHVIMNGGIGREEAEECWIRRHGGRCNAKRAQAGEKHLGGFACYLTQDKRTRTMEKDGKNQQEKAMRRSWNPSKNLVDPEKRASEADKKISIRKAQRIAETMEDFGNAREILEKLYPGYELLEIKARRSRWTAGVYIAAEMRRKVRKNEQTGGQRGKRHAGAYGGRGADTGHAMGKDESRKASGTESAVPHTQRRKQGKG